MTDSKLEADSVPMASPSVVSLQQMFTRQTLIVNPRAAKPGILDLITRSGVKSSDRYLDGLNSAIDKLSESQREALFSHVFNLFRVVPLDTSKMQARLEKMRQNAKADPERLAAVVRRQSDWEPGLIFLLKFAETYPNVQARNWFLYGRTEFFKSALDIVKGSYGKGLYQKNAYNMLLGAHDLKTAFVWWVRGWVRGYELMKKGSSMLTSDVKADWVSGDKNAAWIVMVNPKDVLNLQGIKANFDTYKKEVTDLLMAVFRAFKAMQYDLTDMRDIKAVFSPKFEELMRAYRKDVLAARTTAMVVRKRATTYAEISEATADVYKDLAWDEILG